MSDFSSTRGFTLIETIVATGILVTALAGVAQLFVLSTQLTRQAQASGAAVVAAQDKLEVLRGYLYTYDAAGAPVTDAKLQPSPPNSLTQDIERYVDWIGPGGVARPDSDDAVLVRRWRISPVDAGNADALAVEVCVFRMAESSRADACLATIRSRQP